MKTAGGKLFRKENLNTWTPGDLYLLFPSADIRYMDPDRDRLLLQNIARNAQGTQRKAALRRLGVSEVPEADPDHVSDDIFDESYWILDEQVCAMEDMADIETLKEAAFAPRCEAGAFAFCRLTGYSFLPPECDAYSHRTFDCGLHPQMGPEDVRAFCREMVRRQGPYAEEAKACLLRGGAGSDEQEGRGF